jgi:hypothetical protein
MAAMRPSAPLLASFRRHARPGIALFILLLVLVAAERRLADAHFNLRSAATGFESPDVLDGDEIRVRLIVLNDDHSPVLPADSTALVSDVACAAAPHPDCVALGRPAPRGPPVLSRAAR